MNEGYTIFGVGAKVDKVEIGKIMQAHTMNFYSDGCKPPEEKDEKPYQSLLEIFSWYGEKIPNFLINKVCEEKRLDPILFRKIIQEGGQKREKKLTEDMFIFGSFIEAVRLLLKYTSFTKNTAQQIMLAPIAKQLLEMVFNENIYINPAVTGNDVIMKPMIECFFEFAYRYIILMIQYKNYEEAKKQFGKFLRLSYCWEACAKDMGMNFHQIKAYEKHILALLFLSQQQYESAEQEIKKSIGFYFSAKNKSYFVEIILAKCAKAFVLCKKGKLHDAKKTAEKLIRYYDDNCKQRENEKEVYALCLYVIAKIYKARGSYEKALNFLIEAENIFEDKESLINQIEASLEMVNVYLSRKKLFPLSVMQQKLSEINKLLSQTIGLDDRIFAQYKRRLNILYIIYYSRNNDIDKMNELCKDLKEVSFEDVEMLSNNIDSLIDMPALTNTIKIVGSQVDLENEYTSFARMEGHNELSAKINLLRHRSGREITQICDVILSDIVSTLDSFFHIEMAAEYIKKKGFPEYYQRFHQNETKDNNLKIFYFALTRVQRNLLLFCATIGTEKIPQFLIESFLNKSVSTNKLSIDEIIKGCYPILQIERCDKNVHNRTFLINSECRSFLQQLCSFGKEPQDQDSSFSEEMDWYKIPDSSEDDKVSMLKQTLRVLKDFIPYKVDEKNCDLLVQHVKEFANNVSHEASLKKECSVLFAHLAIKLAAFEKHLESDEFFKKINIKEDLKGDDLKIDAMNARAKICIAMGFVYEAKLLLEDSLRLQGNNPRYRHQRVVALSQLGEAERISGNALASKKNIEECLTLKKELGYDAESIRKTQNSLWASEIHLAKNTSDLARIEKEILDGKYGLFDKTKNGVSAAYVFLASIRCMKKEIAKAEEYISEADACYMSDAKNNISLPWLLLIKGLIFCEKEEEYANAAETLISALKISFDAHTIHHHRTAEIYSALIYAELMQVRDIENPKIKQYFAELYKVMYDVMKNYFKPNDAYAVDFLSQMKTLKIDWEKSEVPAARKIECYFNLVKSFREKIYGKGHPLLEIEDERKRKLLKILGFTYKNSRLSQLQRVASAFFGEHACKKTNCSHGQADSARKFLRVYS